MIVVDVVWVATALLHQQEPARSDFSVSEIVKKMDSVQEVSAGGATTAVYDHTVANRKANPARYCYLFAPGKKTRRLYRKGDDRHPSRLKGKTFPDELPAEYQDLLTWYHVVYDPHVNEDPILALRGLGREIWDEDPDAYVQRLRKNWD